MCVHPFPPVAVGREWDTFGCAGVLPSPSTCFRSATIIYNVSAELPIEGVGPCIFINYWQSLPKAISTQLKLLKQFDRRSAFQALIRHV
ncbi:hypothetical protein J2771_000462 [Acinetobacter calcoaceticus]|uniref:Uncharacterized protein n=1 Tax=Acinetobacter calcoaceticus TaxID=471 RepID=A0ABD5AIN4_ACICA|nr:hypothetical protein [Acinetobacter calcoaceticus]